ncbi:T-cell receptor-associated transmembrane adapter 1 [Rhinatrema bivittatum]|uniref:T-cell receptor-associated transmembrane adapter 1 n=1 Tax=Rhinatrema bivittatum TaxID=194408 RepID=UPI0011273E7B|nr:T-cell receptor-associated transmembrane adapter 1 [Rhinatrema bivittatum]
MHGEKRAMSAGESCPLPIWVVLAILVMALMVSLMMNIVYCKEKQKKAKREIYFEDYTLSYEQRYLENNPIYGNLNQEFIDSHDESFYEQMRARPPRHANNIKMETENQTCYASLALDTKKPRRHRKKKARALDPDVADEELVPPKSSTMTSRNSIYLNSEQLTAEAQANEEAIHDDPIRLFNLIHATRDDATADTYSTPE